jgi:Double zinc ribbon
MDCPICHAGVREGRKFCNQCGAPLPLRCASCGSSNPPSSRFCSECGSQLGAAEAGTVSRIAVSTTASPISASAAERRQLTVMFCDLVGSTALSSQLDPEDLREILSAYHRCVTETVVRFDGGSMWRSNTPFQAWPA